MVKVKFGPGMCCNVGRGMRKMSLRVQAGRNVQKRFEKKDANDGLAG